MLNLDSMPVEDLRKLHDEFRTHVRTTSKKYGLTVRDGKIYKAYAINKLVAMVCRIEGDINTAMQYEAICDRLYRRMIVRQW